MRVDKLEVNGFKSFADRTTFHLHPGVTCIVGPNGCGKSNVVDAFKWVLGEQSAKSLRGGSMQEVIFAGSQNKKPKGMAEVTLHLSGINPGSGGYADTVSVSRRLYRSGESDYLLNRKSCRLKDIRDMFLDTGLEMKSYSILEQERISVILSARPEERRFLIEEVAGVVKYRIRRNEAQSKLESSRGNLLRISDITAEIKRQIGSLDRQARKAERYKALMQELRDIELRLAGSEYERKADRLMQIVGELIACREDVALLRGSLSGGETGLETGRLARAEKEKALAALSGEFRDVERRMAEIERTLAVSENERQNLTEYSGRLAGELSETLGRIEESEARRVEVTASMERMGAESATIEAELKEREQVLKAAEREISSHEGLVDDKGRELERIADKAAQLNNELNRMQATLEALSAKQDAIGRDREETTRIRDEAEAQVRGMEASILDKKNRALVLQEEIRTLDAECHALKNSIEDLRARMAEARESLASSASRMKSLKEMVAADRDPEDLRDAGVADSISDVLRVPRQYERAVESALGEVVAGFFVRDMAGLSGAVGVINGRGIERTAFMPIGGPGAAGFEEPGLPAGAMAWASQAVSAAPEYLGATRALLRGIAIVKDFDAAIALSGAATEGRITLVTLTGDVLMPSGAATAGKSKGILSLKRQIRELKDECTATEGRIAALEAETDQARERLKKKIEDLERVRAQHQQTDREVSLLKVKAEGHGAERDRANRKLSQLMIELGEIDRKKEATLGQIKAREGEGRTFRDRIAEIRAEVEALKAQIGQKKLSHENRRAETVELRLSLNSCRERLSALGGERQSVESMVRELRHKAEYIGREQASAAERLAAQERDREGREAALRELVGRAADLRGRLQEARAVLENEAETLAELERSIRATRVEIDRASGAASELDVRRAELTVSLHNLTDIIRTNYQVELPLLEAEEPREGDQQEREEIRQKIERLGPVSLGSIDEYNELKERYDFQVRQQEDLEKSIAELEEAITRINSTTRRLLREAFALLRDKFAEVFTMLFGGGKAELRLTDENNILETGIEIIAQPPGKKFQSITLLSGGEKTLTALALLFSGFLIKPTPVCILDEADAALDETNTGKFSQMIKRLSGDIQFLVVTHNRTTMEVADHIYGVTMQDPGTSNIIGMQLGELPE